MSYEAGKQAALEGKTLADNPHTNGFTKLGSRMPDLIALPDRQLLIKVGAYASPGHRFSYRHVNFTQNFDGEIKDWIRYSQLNG